MPTPVVALNHAVAVAMVSGPAAGLELLDKPWLAKELSTYQHYHSARGELLSTVDPVAAKDALGKALSLATNPAERRLLKKKIREI